MGEGGALLTAVLRGVGHDMMRPAVVVDRLLHTAEGLLMFSGVQYSQHVLEVVTTVDVGREGFWHNTQHPLWGAVYKRVVAGPASLSLPRCPHL